MSTSTSERAEQIHNDLPDDVNASVPEIKTHLKTLTEDFGVPGKEAQQTVERKLLDEAGLDPDNHGSSGPETVEAASISTAGKWVNLEAQVVFLKDDTHDSIAQQGVLADDSGTIKFTLWAKSAEDLPTLVEGESYEFNNVVTDKYQGRYSVKINSSSAVVRSDAEFDTDEATAVSGSVVDIPKGSGLIERCGHDDCTRTLRDGRCSDHGEVDGYLDLRIKMVLDDGTDIKRLLFDAEQTEALTGISLDDAKDMAMEALDREAVADRIEEMLVGNYLTADVEQVGQYYLVQDASILEEVPEAETVLVRGRSMQVTEQALSDALA